jgi:transposase
VPQETDAEKIARLERKIEQLQRENERLRRQLEEALRAVKRQAAPFSRRFPKAHPRPAGRKRGRCYGRKAYRAVPAEVEQSFEAQLPGHCPQCGGEIAETGVVEQYQSEIPEPRVERIRFRVHLGRCRRCGRRVQGRHPRQSSNAVGSAGSQLGPRAVVLATQLNKGLGLPYGKTAAVLEQAFGLVVTRGGLCQAIARVGRKAEPTYRHLIEQVRASASVTPDETGWKVGGRLWWLWVFATPRATVYAIQPGRGFEQAAAVLGEDFAGFLVRDGWAVYRRFGQAVHQTCLAHLLRRCREMIELAPPGGASARFPRVVKEILQRTLALRHRRDHGEISEMGLAVARGRLEARLDRVLGRHYRSTGNERLANHLAREREAIFPFLGCPGLEATNWRAEQALRPAVVARKVWGGSRTEQGAKTQQILVSLLATCRQQNHPAQAPLVSLLCSPQPRSLDLSAADLPPPRRHATRRQSRNPMAHVGRARRIVERR